MASMTRWLPILGPIGLVIVMAIAATAPARQGDFIYDDVYYVVENPAVVGEADVWTAPLGDASQALWRPLTVATWRWQWDPRRISAAPFLTVNIALHVLTSVLVLALARRWGLSRPAGLLAAVLFAVHPVHAEAVGWVSGRAELLAALGVLLSWLAYLSPRRGAGIAAALLLAAAGLCKENALTAPALFLVADFLLPDRRPDWRRLVALGLAVIAVVSARVALLPTLLPGDAPYGEFPLSGRLVIAANILARSVDLLAWPTPLTIHYHRDEFSLLGPGTLLTLGLLSGFAIVLRRDRRFCAALILIPLSLAPVLNLVPIGETFAERFLYLPSVFFCLAIAAAIQRLARLETERGSGPGFAVVCALVIVVVATPASRAAITVLSNDLEMWSHAARVSPLDAHSRYNHGYYLHEAGRFVTEDISRPGSREELRVSLRLEPQHRYAAFAHQMLGNYAMGAIGGFAPDAELAAGHFRTAIELQPTFIDAHINLAALAVGAPAVVGRSEGLASLAMVLAQPDLAPDKQLAAEELWAQLSVDPTPEGS